MIEKRASFNTIRYANCWEDADILQEALQMKEGGSYLSIASSGDNSLALLAHNPALVIAFDISTAQLSSVELKKICFEHLSYKEMLKFLGVLDTNDRISSYFILRRFLSDRAKRFWDLHLSDIQKGIIHAGKFEHYFSLFRKWVLPLIHRKKTRALLLQPKSAAELQEFYDKKWNTWRWRLAFKLFFSKKVMGDVGRDPEFFKYVEKDVATSILKRVKEALTTIPSHNNPYLTYILTGNFQKRALPFYLREENFEKIRINLDKIVFFEGNLDEVLAHHKSEYFDGFNLSDIFEYMSFSEYKESLKALLSRSNRDARIVYWNMLAERKEVEELQHQMKFLNSLAKELHAKDKAFFYQGLVIGQAP